MRVMPVFLVLSLPFFSLGETAEYDEPLRPQFHFTARRGYNNDPNGMTYFNGQWHLFFQHNPHEPRWGNIHWGHAVSDDLLHWRDLGDAIVPDDAGILYSGSAAVDLDNSAGFGKGAQLLLFPVVNDRQHPREQHLAYSLDGRNYVRYSGNPVMPWGEFSADRMQKDPELFWHAPLGKWISLLVVTEKGRHQLAILHSSDAKNWERVGTISGDPVEQGIYLYDCPDMFELPVAGTLERRWVLICGNRQYAVGDFDGFKFVPESERLESYYAADDQNEWYAGQTFENAPRGRRVQMCWWHGRRFKDMVFNHGMSLPMELGLFRTAEGIRLTRHPIDELKGLRRGGAVGIDDFDGELLEAEVSCDLTADATVTYDLRGVKVIYSNPRKTLSVQSNSRTLSVQWKVPEERLALHIFLDRQGIEIFSEDGLQTLPVGSVIADARSRKCKFSAHGSKNPVSNRVERFYELKSIWRD